MQETTPPQDPMQNWFGSLPETQPAPKKSRKKWLFIILGLLVLGIGIIAAYLVLRPAECLTKADYKALIGQEYGDNELDARNNFYTYLVSFKPDEAAYDGTAGDPTGDQIINKISQFYSSHKGKSLRISIGSTFSDSKDQGLATQRVQHIGSQLVSAGIPVNNIQIVTPVISSPEDEPEKITTATVTVTSADNCRE